MTPRTRAPGASPFKDGRKATVSDCSRAGPRPLGSPARRAAASDSRRAAARMRRGAALLSCERRLSDPARGSPLVGAQGAAARADHQTPPRCKPVDLFTGRPGHDAPAARHPPALEPPRRAVMRRARLRIVGDLRYAPAPNRHGRGSGLLLPAAISPVSSSAETVSGQMISPGTPGTPCASQRAWSRRTCGTSRLPSRGRPE